MSPSREDILRKLESGAIGVDEAKRLLREADTAGTPLSNPVAHLGPLWALLLATACAAACVALSRLGVRFCGFIDVHVGDGPVPLDAALLDQLAAWPLSALVLMLACQLAGGSRRPSGYLLAVGVARLPLFLVGGAGVIVAWIFRRAPEGPLLYVALALGIASLLLVGAFLVWLYRGLRFASGLKPMAAGIALALGGTAAELISVWVSGWRG